MDVRRVGLAVAAALICGPALGQDAAPKAQPLPWTERPEVGNDYLGVYTPDDLRVPINGRQVAVKCAILPSNDGDGFEVSIRKAPGNTTFNLMTLSLAVEVGVGSCREFKPLRTSYFDPAGSLGLGDNGRVRFYASGGDYIVRIYSVAKEPEKDVAILRLRKLDPSVKARKFEAGVAGVAAASEAAASTGAIEQARAAYLSLCAQGAPKLSATTCEAMRRDLEASVAAQAASKREAEVMGVYNQVCAPGKEKLSKDTCASMLAEAKKSLAAPPAPRPVPNSAPRGKSRTTYDELCKPGAEQVSAETCAALKEDAEAGR